jgi:hypothetical protein
MALEGNIAWNGGEQRELIGGQPEVALERQGQTMQHSTGGIAPCPTLAAWPVLEAIQLERGAIQRAHVHPHRLPSPNFCTPSCHPPPPFVQRSAALPRASSNPTLTPPSPHPTPAALTRSASGMARLPVPQPASQTVVPCTLPSWSSQRSTFSTVCAWPLRMSSCTCAAPAPNAREGAVRQQLANCPLVCALDCSKCRADLRICGQGLVEACRIQAQCRRHL